VSPFGGRGGVSTQLNSSASGRARIGDDEETRRHVLVGVTSKQKNVPSGVMMPYKPGAHGGIDDAGHTVVALPQTPVGSDTNTS
jgi:hypothetical protein